MVGLQVLVLGATGRFASVVPSLRAAGHRVRAATRNPGSPGARTLRKSGIEVVRADLDDADTIAAAATGVDAMFAAGTAHGAGPAGDEMHGRNVIDAARAVGTAHLVYISVAGAGQPSDVPLFESKRHVEDYLVASGVPFTIVAPVYFMENVWNSWNAPALARGRFPTPIPPARRLQQIPIGEVIDFTIYLLARRERFVGQRLELASDELSALEAVEIVGELTGKRLEIDPSINGGLLPLFSWLDRVGYAIDIAGLRQRFPDLSWRGFRDWAKTQDWSILGSVRNSQPP
jgi:uncharacterized protein YbjT (DUF2867 family)